MSVPMLPIVAIVGRPNVGKSSLLNALLGRRLAIGEVQHADTATFRFETQDRSASAEFGVVGMRSDDQYVEHFSFSVGLVCRLCGAGSASGPSKKSHAKMPRHPEYVAVYEV